MGTLLLTSAGFENPHVGAVFTSLLPKIADAKVLFFPTAARTKEERFYVGKCLEELRNLGFRDIRERDMNHAFVPREFEEADVVYVCGGNTFYLLKKMRECGFKQALDPFLKRGGVYVGVSAGSVIAGPSIQIAGPWDENDVGLTDLSGLNLVPYALSPHYNVKDHAKVESMRQLLPCPLVTLRDDQAMVVRDWDEQLIG